jgi:hypothetical protein
MQNGVVAAGLAAKSGVVAAELQKKRCRGDMASGVVAASSLSRETSMKSGELRVLRGPYDIEVCDREASCDKSLSEETATPCGSVESFLVR